MSDKMSRGAIVGIIIGIVLLFALFFAVAPFNIEAFANTQNDSLTQNESLLTPIKIPDKAYESSWGATFLTISDNLTFAFLTTMDAVGIVGAGTTGNQTTSQIYLSVSTDGGQNWGKNYLVTGKDSTHGSFMASPVYNSITNTMFLAYAWYNGSSEFHIKQAIVSDNPQWENDHVVSTNKYYLMPSSSAGFYDSTRSQMVIPVAWLKKDGYYQSSVLTSKDGQVWNVSNPIDFAVPTGNGIDEPAVVQLDNGDYLALVRTNQYYLGESISKDGGTTWSPVVSSGIWTLGGGDRGEQAELRSTPIGIMLAYSSNATDMTIRITENGTWSAPVALIDVGSTQRDTYNSFPHIAITGNQTAVISWWQVYIPEVSGSGNITWQGKYYSFRPDELFKGVNPSNIPIIMNNILPPIPIVPQPVQPSPILQPITFAPMPSGGGGGMPIVIPPVVAPITPVVDVITDNLSWKPDFHSANPYDGINKSYIKMVEENFVPTEHNPLNPIIAWKE